MSTGFTPGPWLYRPHEYDDWGYVRCQPDDVLKMGGIICQARDPAVSDEEQLNEHRRNGTDPWAANAHLIAAAPSLYEALKAARFYVNECRFSGALTEKGHSECAEVLANLDAALAKARGEA
jgi:hypothetical protein